MSQRPLYPCPQLPPPVSFNLRQLALNQGMLWRLTGIPYFGTVDALVNVFVFPLCIWLLGGIICCKAAGEIITARSSSGQFVAREIQAFAYPTTPANAVRTKMALSLIHI